MSTRRQHYLWYLLTQARVQACNRVNTKEGTHQTGPKPNLASKPCLCRRPRLLLRHLHNCRGHRDRNWHKSCKLAHIDFHGRSRSAHLIASFGIIPALKELIKLCVCTTLVDIWTSQIGAHVTRNSLFVWNTNYWHHTCHSSSSSSGHNLCMYDHDRWYTKPSRGHTRYVAKTKRRRRRRRRRRKRL